MRAAFSEGVKRDRGYARLLQAWGLFESKHGKPATALALVEHAVRLDPSLGAILRWERFATIRNVCRNAWFLTIQDACAEASAWWHRGANR